MRVKNFGGLDVRLTGGADGDGGGDGTAVILLHGFGAPGDDLVPLSQALRVPEETRFAFPAAPLKLDGGFGGRAWWMLDIEKFAADVASGRRHDTRIAPPGLSEAREKILAMLEAMEAEWGLPPGGAFLGGFSQGAMLACDVAAQSARDFAGLIVMSGGITAEEEWEAGWPARAGLPVFQSHGTDDPLLAYDIAERLRDSLRGHGLRVEWRGFRGGHEIPMEVVEGVGEFIGGRRVSEQ